MPNELKPCPFCGSTAKLYSQKVVGGYDYSYVICSSCGIRTQNMKFQRNIVQRTKQPKIGTGGLTMAKFPTMDEFAKSVAEKALDDYMYEGKTIREWTEIILNGDLVNVVRCKDCIKRSTEDCAMYYECDCGEQHTWNVLTIFAVTEKGGQNDTFDY